MKGIKELFIRIFVGQRNRKYLGKYLVAILVLKLLSNVSVDFIKGSEVSLWTVTEHLLIIMTVLFVFFRLWIWIYEGTLWFWSKVLKLESVEEQ